MRYQIKRIAWSEETYNGFTDSPYWLISFDGYEIGLKDNGKVWSIINDVNIKTEFIQEKIETIISECKLQINLRM